MNEKMINAPMSLQSRISRRRVARILGSGAVAAAMPWLHEAPTAAQDSDNIAANVVVPEPVVFPQDSGIHDDAATEWWYYTGHLFTETQEKYGFEYVIFRARRGDLAGFVSHFAITDNVADTFTYAQQIVGEDGVIGSDAVLDLDLTGAPVLVFRHAGSGRVNIVYRRSDGNIGWIDPPVLEGSMPS